MAKAKTHALIPGIPINEQRGRVFAQKLIDYIGKRKGRYLRDEAGHLHVVLDGCRIPLNDTPENHRLAGLMFDACNVSTVSQAARAAIQKLQVEASRKAGQMQLRKFSALSSDGTRLYVPLHSGQLLQITADGLTCFENGENQDHLWVEHPSGDPLQYSPGDIPAGLAHFERLLVETQACTVPSIRWLVAMNAGFFALVRDSCPARFLLELIGGTQQGKTSGAERFTLLHGLGLVKGDYTVAALAALGDIGLLVLDNKEQTNFNQPLIDFCLFLATGAERGRSQTDGRLRTGQIGRSVGVITTIEGVPKAELRARCVQIQYGVSGQKLARGPIEHEITARRHEIGSAMVHVLPRYFQIRNERRPTPNPIPDFEEHFSSLCDLLRAFGDVTLRAETWAESIIAEWTTTLGQSEPEENELEHKIRRVIEDGSWGQLDRAFGSGGVQLQAVDYQGKKGKVFVTECGPLLTALQLVYPQDRSFPQNPNGLGRRLRGNQFRSFTVLDEDSKTGWPCLKRTSSTRPIGFFFAD